MSPSNDQPNAWGAAVGAYGKKPQQQGQQQPATGAQPMTTPPAPVTQQPVAQPQQQAAPAPQATPPPSRSYYGEQSHPPQMQGTQQPQPHQQMHSGIRHGAPDAMPTDTSQPPSMSMGAPDAMPMVQGAPPSSFLGSEPMGGSPDSYLSGPPPTAGDAMPMQGDGMGSQHMRQRRNRVM